MKAGRIIRLKRALRNPIWTPIGVFVAFTSLIVTILVSNWFLQRGPSAPNRLIISSDTQKDLTDIPGPVGDHLKFLVDGKEERDLRLFIFRVEYVGDQPLRPGDFSTPVIGRVPTNRKLLAVQKSANLSAPRRYDRQTQAMRDNPHPPATFEASILDAHSFEIKPFLMNPDEWFGVEIYTSTIDPDKYVPPKDSTEKYKELSSEVSWSCHVANVQCPAAIDLESDYGFVRQPDFLEVSVIHMGWSVYFIIIFDVLNLIV